MADVRRRNPALRQAPVRQAQGKGGRRQPCAISGCTAGAKAGQLMCREHWFLVPVAERREVDESWHEVRVCQKALELHDRIARYRAAVKAAVDAVMAKYAEAAQ